MTEAVIMITEAILPALLLWIYTSKKDTQKEPMPQMVKALLYGMGIVVPVILIEEVFCTKMHKFAHRKKLAHIDKDLLLTLEKTDNHNETIQTFNL